MTAGLVNLDRVVDPWATGAMGMNSCLFKASKKSQVINQV